MAEQTANIGALTNPEVPLTALSDVASNTLQVIIIAETRHMCRHSLFYMQSRNLLPRRFAGICGLFRVRTLHESPEDALAFIART